VEDRVLHACQHFADCVKNSKKALDADRPAKIQRTRKVAYTCGGVNEWLRKMGLTQMNKYATDQGGRGGPTL
jgi:hypothetical protein